MLSTFDICWMKVFCFVFFSAQGLSDWKWNVQDVTCNSAHTLFKHTSDICKWKWYWYQISTNLFLSTSLGPLPEFHHVLSQKCLQEALCFKRKTYLCSSKKKKKKNLQMLERYLGSFKMPEARVNMYSCNENLKHVVQPEIFLIAFAFCKLWQLKQIICYQCFYCSLSMRKSNWTLKKNKYILI